jgi:hypothetical protein
MIKKRRKYKAKVKVLEKRITIAGNSDIYYKTKHFY